MGAIQHRTSSTFVGVDVKAPEAQIKDCLFEACNLLYQYMGSYFLLIILCSIVYPHNLIIYILSRDASLKKFQAISKTIHVLATQKSDQESSLSHYYNIILGIYKAPTQLKSYSKALLLPNITLWYVTPCGILQPTLLTLQFCLDMLPQNSRPLARQYRRRPLRNPTMKLAPLSIRPWCHSSACYTMWYILAHHINLIDFVWTCFLKILDHQKGNTGVGRSEIPP